MQAELTLMTSHIDDAGGKTGESGLNSFELIRTAYDAIHEVLHLYVVQ